MGQLIYDNINLIQGVIIIFVIFLALYLLTLLIFYYRKGNQSQASTKSISVKLASNESLIYSFDDLEYITKVKDRAWSMKSSFSNRLGINFLLGAVMKGYSFENRIQFSKIEIFMLVMWNAS